MSESELKSSCEQGGGKDLLHFLRSGGLYLMPVVVVIITYFKIFPHHCDHSIFGGGGLLW